MQIECGGGHDFACLAIKLCTFTVVVGGGGHRGCVCGCSP